MSVLLRNSYRPGLAAILGGLILGTVVAQPPNPQTGGGSVGGNSAQPNVEFTRPGDPLENMLTDARATCSKMRDYTCVFTRQERINGILSAEQVAEMKVRVQPSSIQVRFARPETVAGMEQTFVSGTRSENMRYRAPRTRGINAFVIIPVDDPKVMAETRHTIKEIGIAGVLDRIALSISREKSQNNPVDVHTAEFQFAGRNVTRYEITTPRPHAYRYAYKQMIYVDKETKLPLRVEAYDTPKNGSNTGELIEAYSYTDIKMNVGLGDSAFD